MWLSATVQIRFHPSPRPTVGVEWEFALVDRASRDLVGRAPEVIASAAQRLGSTERVHAELLQNTVELVTGVCDTVAEAIQELRETHRVVAAAAEEHGAALFGAGAHPFAAWNAQELSPGPRYAELIDRTQWWGRQMLIWGVHVHVGLAEVDRVMPVLSGLLSYFPHLQALSASSPIWAGQDTGYASNRALMFQQLPTAGLPFQFDTWAQFEAFAADQLTTGVIDTLSEIRWDLRPAAHFGTLENRVCDGISTFTELESLTALMQCLVVDLDRRVAAGQTLPTLPPWHVQENKWRTARYGLDSIIIVDAKNTERLVTEDLADLLTRLEPVAIELGCARELRAVAQIPARGASYQRQRAVAERTGGDLRAVVDAVVAETWS